MHRKNIAVLAAVLIVLAASWTAAPASAAESETKATVKVAGLRVNAEPYNGSSKMRPFNYPAGTMLVLQVTHPDGGLYGIDAGESSVKKFRDDAGTDLLSGESSFFQPGFQTNVRTSKDGKAALVSVYGPGRPAEKARKIDLRGTVHLKRSSGTETVRAEDVKVQEGTSFSLGSSSFTLAGTERSFGQTMVILETDIEQERVADITLYDTQGNDVTGSACQRQPGLIGQSVKPGTTLDTLTVEMTLRQDVETISVPVEKTISVGL